MQKFFGLLLFLASVLLPARGLAQESVAVLGLQSVEGDDEIATALGSEIRAAAGEVPGWTVSSNATNIAQMSSGSDCADVDTSCLHRIAGTRQARHIIYGPIHRRSEATSNGWFVNMTHFDDERGEIVAQGTDPFARDTVLSAFAHGLLARLQPAPAEETTQPEPVPTPSNDHDLLRGFAVGLAVLGVGAFGGTIASWVRINDIQLLLNGASMPFGDAVGDVENFDIGTDSTVRSIFKNKLSRPVRVRFRVSVVGVNYVDNNIHIGQRCSDGQRWNDYVAVNQSNRGGVRYRTSRFVSAIRNWRDDQYNR